MPRCCARRSRRCWPGQGCDVDDGLKVDEHQDCSSATALESGLGDSKDIKPSAVSADASTCSSFDGSSVPNCCSSPTSSSACASTWTAEDDEEFLSCDEQAVVEAVAPREPSRSYSLSVSRAPSANSTPTTSPRSRLQGLTLRPAVNKNHVSHFAWLQDLLQSIVASDTARLVDESANVVPLFVVAGACPSPLCSSMQAVMFSEIAGAVDFWWIKPSRVDPTQLERETLRLHSSGPFKNTPGRSRSFYSPMSEKFAVGVDGDFVFGVDSSGRAFIEEEADGGRRRRLLIYFVWQESWGSPIGFRKFIRGKICYQKGDPDVPGPRRRDAPRFFARQYEIEGGRISIAPRSEEETIPTLLPPDSFQEMYDMPR